MNWKIHRDNFLKIFKHGNIVLCTYHRNLFFDFRQFDHHWKILKTLDLNTYQGFLFWLFIVFSGYFNEFIYEIMKWNISKIKHHSYEVINLQVYLIISMLTQFMILLEGSTSMVFSAHFPSLKKSDLRWLRKRQNLSRLALITWETNENLDKKDWM